MGELEELTEVLPVRILGSFKAQKRTKGRPSIESTHNRGRRDPRRIWAPVHTG